ncbi:hypothetical protein [Arenibacter amylolyticus]|uniref:hypothetical protein n=1 Tax=Arenibacter amylolyticus TaxID=1406873 RepID=UPI000A396748|nr:hypothetical protein [Arenibacter amylolyticus]
MKLDQHQLSFIDTYLKNSGIAYVDLRMEMLDHVATGVLESMNGENTSFYEAFKSYMVVNKKELLKWNKKFRKVTDVKVLQALKTNLCTPISALAFLACILLLKMGAESFNLITTYRYIPLGVLLVMLCFYCYTYRIVFGKNRFSGLERIGTPLLIFQQGMLFLFSPFYSKVFFQEQPLIYYTLISLFVVTGMAFIRIIHTFKKEYVLHFQIA